jgi:ribosome-associated toxin RatA of RatAB toxin-antitoxin module
MPDVLDVTFAERAPTSARSEWRVLLNGTELTWTEHDLFEPERRVVFEQIDGDLEVFRGTWELDEAPGGVEVTLDVEFDLGIPSLSSTLDPIGTRAVASNSHKMLAAIRGMSA